jgi:CheY-like chemotaxis protein
MPPNRWHSCWIRWAARLRMMAGRHSRSPRPNAPIWCSVTWVCRGNIDGFAVVRAARADEQLQNTRFVAVAGSSQPNDHAQVGRAGFEQLVPKPITLETIEKLSNDKVP